MDQTINEIANCDKFKEKSEVLKPDERIFLWGGGSNRNFDLFYTNISKCILTNSVPEEVRVQFETAKNVLLYSFYAYRMSEVAKLHAYSVLELSLKKRINKHLIENEDDLKGSMGLRAKLNFAVEKRWISKDDFFFQSSLSRSKEEQERNFNFFIYRRNKTVHEPTNLDILWGVPEFFGIISKLINEMWKY